MIRVRDKGTNTRFSITICRTFIWTIKCWTGWARDIVDIGATFIQEGFLACWVVGKTAMTSSDLHDLSCIRRRKECIAFNRHWTAPSDIEKLLWQANNCKRKTQIIFSSWFWFVKSYWLKQQKIYARNCKTIYISEKLILLWKNCFDLS